MIHTYSTWVSIKKRYFSNTKILRADPATTTVVATATLTGVVPGLLILPMACLFSITILTYWFLPSDMAVYPDLTSVDLVITNEDQPVGIRNEDNIILGQNLIELYLQIINNSITGLTENLSLLNQVQLQEAMDTLRTLSVTHEFVYHYFNHFLRDWANQFGEGTEYYEDYDDLLIQWREIGNSILDLYRTIETQAGLPEYSTWSARWFE